jgi:thioredoxin:protein disulfide reductase
MNLKKLVGVISLLLIIGLFNSSFCQDEGQVKLSVKEKSIKTAKGKNFNITLLAKVKSGWHINSNKPNDDFLIPSSVSVNGKGLTLLNVSYPAAKEKKLSFSEKPVSIYEGEFPLALTLKSDKKVRSGKQTIELKFDYQACNDKTCMAPASVSIKTDIIIK